MDASFVNMYIIMQWCEIYRLIQSNVTTVYVVDVNKA